MAQLATTRETEGYDGTWGKTKWWFEAWGSGPKSEWYRRDDIGRPPRTDELRTADYIVIGIQKGRRQPIFRTHTGGLDLDPRVMRPKRKRKK